MIFKAVIAFDLCLISSDILIWKKNIISVEFSELCCHEDLMSILSFQFDLCIYTEDNIF